jgi:cell division protein FtsX
VFCLVTLSVWSGRLGIRTVARWASLVEQNVNVIAYLSPSPSARSAPDAPDASPDLAQELRALVLRLPGVAGARVVEPAEALAELRTLSTSLGADAKALAVLEPGFFPRSLEIRLSPSPDLPERALALAHRLRSVPGVEQVDAMTGGLASLAAWLKLARRLGWALLTASGLLSLILLIAVFARHQSAARTRTTVLLQLGDSEGSARAPGAACMMLCALAGGAIGASALRLAWRPLLANIERSLGIAFPGPLPILSWTEILVGLAATCLLGLGLGYHATPLPRTIDRA